MFCLKTVKQYIDEWKDNCYLLITINTYMSFFNFIFFKIINLLDYDYLGHFGENLIH